jgi:hypothetical protein
MKRSEIIAEAKSYMRPKTPWAHAKRSRTGTDCIGFICLVGDHFDVPYTDYPHTYSREPQGEKFLDHLKKYLVIGEQKLKTGQVVVLRDGRLPCHVGFIEMRGKEPWLIHCSIGGRGVIEEKFDAPGPKGSWRTRMRILLEFPGVEDD